MNEVDQPAPGQAAGQASSPASSPANGPVPARPRPTWASGVAAVLRGMWAVLDATRRTVLNLALPLLLLGLVAGYVASRPAALKDQTVLVMDLRGRLVEQASGGAREQALQHLQGAEDGQTVLRDVLRALDHAARDPQISSVLLRLDEFQGSGLASLREVALALERFKASGKKVVAWGSSFDQRQYYLAAHAGEVYLHPMGVVMIEGLGRQRNYYRDALDRLGVAANVLRVGKYKNAAEPYFANAPSKASLEAEAHVLDAVWSLYTQGVERARALPEGSIAKAIDGLPGILKDAGGNAAQLALNLKWIDGLKTRDELRALLIERGAEDTERKTFRQESLGAYLSRLPKPAEGPAVGVVVAEGEISDGKAPPGQIGGLSTADLIRKARQDEQIKAVVLRVNSPGGSAFGSELVRRELELTREAGKPVVVSMGNVAASGGYWISMAADEVIAEPATITGSIGVFGMLPTADGLMDKISVRTGGYRTTWLAGAYDPRLKLDARYAELVQQAINHIYADFTSKAAQARNTTPQKIDDVAQGRIWTGAQALGHGLVDRTGSFGDAIKSAAAKAKLAEDAPLRYMEPEGDRISRLLKFIDAQVLGGLAQLLMPHEAALADAASNWRTAWPVAALTHPAVAEARADLGWLLEGRELRGPMSAFVHCLCTSGL